MSDFGIRTLKEQNEHLLVLASTLGYPMTQLRANHFRSSERALTHLRHFFTEELSLRCKEWHSTCRSVSLLRSRLTQLQAVETQRNELGESLGKLEQDLLAWKGIDPAERKELRELSELASRYLGTARHTDEDAILERYELYCQLGGLIPYAEEVEHLCAAVRHYLKREEYEAESLEIDGKLNSAEIRVRSVRRGFYLAVGLCFLIVTIPLCLPFAFSLWNRLREVNLQCAQLRESRRRVDRKLELAAEGVVAAEDITSVLGERSLADVRGVLEQVKELNHEFGHMSDSTPLVTKALLKAVANRELLHRAFGDGPEAFRERLGWIVRMQEYRNRQSREILRLAEQLVSAQEEAVSLLKGYTPEILMDTVLRLEDRRDALEKGDVSPELFDSWARLCRSMPETLTKAQHVLSLVSYGEMVSNSEWHRAALAVVTASTTLNAIVAEAELSSKEFSLGQNAG